MFLSAKFLNRQYILAPSAQPFFPAGNPLGSVGLMPKHISVLQAGRGAMKRQMVERGIACLTAIGFASNEDKNKAEDRLTAAATVLDENQGAPDQGIPEELLESAECVAVVPTMLKGGFIVGARYGRGVASCRTPKGWSAPAFFTIKGGSFGLQIGGQAVDLVMLIMNNEGMENLLSSKVKLGADASAAAGPVGR